MIAVAALVREFRPVPQFAKVLTTSARLAPASSLADDD